MTPPRFTITAADNGWIVRVHSSGPFKYSPERLKDVIDSRLLVFDDWHKLYEWMMRFCGPKEVRG
jgi:hypothetical protein